MLRGPRRLYGARGWGRGFYIRDPDGNVVELRNYRLVAEAPTVGSTALRALGSVG